MHALASLALCTQRLPARPRSIFQAILFAVAALVLATAISVGLVAYSHSRQRQPWKVVVNVTIFFRCDPCRARARTSMSRG